jgi:anti-sigma factor ChrR (cupin superfamily)
MACTRYLTSIQELVDGTLGPIRRADLESHLEACDDCRALKADLESIRDAAGALGELPVPDRAWLQIAGRLRQEGRIHDAEVVRRGRSGRYAILALAAGLIVAIGASLVLLMPGARPQPPAVVAPAPGNPADPKAVEVVQNEVDQAQKQLETAIAHMEQITKANQQALDPKTAATLDKNLGIIDQAIAETRAAVKAEPTSVAARATLFEALKQKVNVLQDTIALMNEMRKGNNAGAAQIVDGLNKS